MLLLEIIVTSQQKDVHLLLPVRFQVASTHIEYTIFRKSLQFKGITRTLFAVISVAVKPAFSSLKEAT